MIYNCFCGNPRGRIVRNLCIFPIINIITLSLMKEYLVHGHTWVTTETPVRLQLKLIYFRRGLDIFYNTCPNRTMASILSSEPCNLKLSLL